MTASWTDDAPSCTLPTAERPLRQAAFDRLFAETLVDARRLARDRAVLALAGPAGTEQRVRDLAAAETSCCSFFDFTVMPVPPGGAAERVTLEVRVPRARAAVLDALVDRARAAASGPRA